MKKKLISAILTAVLFASCAGNSGKRFQNFTAPQQTAETPEPFIITDYKNRADGEMLPEWVEAWLKSGISEVEKLAVYRDRYVFVSWNEGNNFNALTQWSKGFSPELDFPRLAAARIEDRLSASVPFPDDEYGAFFETLIRTASDASWTGAIREEDFWIYREYESGAGESPVLAEDQEPGGRNPAPEKEAWGFLILVTIKKTLFASQLNEIFLKVNPAPQPSRDQVNAANRVKERFFDGF